MKATIHQLRECACIERAYASGAILNKERVCRMLDALGHHVLRVVCALIPHELYGDQV